MDEVKNRDGWWYSKWIGIMYGRVPVGLIGFPIFLAVLISTYGV
jgi:tetrahydromethanopterin S-methyltransferase subunit G